jgi:hypothetical protein
MDGDGDERVHGDRREDLPQEEEADRRVDDEGTDDQVVHVKPFADLRRLEFVQILTRRQDDNRR